MTPPSDNTLTAYKRLMSAALDQPYPTAKLTKALNRLLKLKKHPNALHEGLE